MDTFRRFFARWRGRRGSAEPRRPRHTIIEYAVTIAVAIVIAILVQAYAVKPFRIPTPSMADTVRTDDRVLIDRITYRFRLPHRGDVIVFGGQGPIPLLKRVVGVPGDTLSLRGGYLYVNGQLAPDGYVRRIGGRIEQTLPVPTRTCPGVSTGRSWCRPGSISSWATTAQTAPTAGSGGR